MRWPFRLPSRFESLLLTAALGLVLATARVAAAPTVFAVVASPDVQVKGLSQDELRRIFLFKKTMWKPGQGVGVILPESGLPARSFLLQKIYRLSDPELRRLILERLFQGEIDLAPKVARSDKDALTFVASTHGQIAVVSAGTEGLAQANVLRIDEKLPGEPGYPLVE